MGMDPVTQAAIITGLGGVIGGAASPNPYQQRRSFAHSGADPASWLTQTRDALTSTFNAASARANEPIDVSGAQVQAPRRVSGGVLPMSIGVTASPDALNAKLGAPKRVPLDFNPAPTNAGGAADDSALHPTPWDGSPIDSSAGSTDPKRRYPWVFPDADTTPPSTDPRRRYPWMPGGDQAGTPATGTPAPTTAPAPAADTPVGQANPRYPWMNADAGGGAETPAKSAAKLMLAALQQQGQAA